MIQLILYSIFINEALSAVTNPQSRPSNPSPPANPPAAKKIQSNPPTHPAPPTNTATSIKKKAGEKCMAKTDCATGLGCQNWSEKSGGVCANEKHFQQACSKEGQPCGSSGMFCQNSHQKAFGNSSPSLSCSYAKCSTSQACSGDNVCINGNCQRMKCLQSKDCGKHFSGLNFLCNQGYCHVDSQRGTTQGTDTKGSDTMGHDFLGSDPLGKNNAALVSKGKQVTFEGQKYVGSGINAASVDSSKKAENLPIYTPEGGKDGIKGPVLIDVPGVGKMPFKFVEEMKGSGQMRYCPTQNDGPCITTNARPSVGKIPVATFSEQSSGWSLDDPKRLQKGGQMKIDENVLTSTGKTYNTKDGKYAVLKMSNDASDNRLVVAYAPGRNYIYAPAGNGKYCRTADPSSCIQMN